METAFEAEWQAALEWKRSVEQRKAALLARRDVLLEEWQATMDDGVAWEIEEEIEGIERELEQI